MAHLVRIRAMGAWVTASVVDPAEFEAFDANLSKCINGDEGGTWAPSAAIILGGSGVQFTGGVGLGGASVPAAGFVNIGGVASVVSGAQMQVNSGATFAFATGSTLVGDITISGNLLLGGGNVIPSQNWLWNGGNVTLDAGADLLLNSGCTATFNDTVNITGGALNLLSGTVLTAGSANFTALQCGGTADLTTVNVTGAMSIQDPVTLSGDGHIRKRVVAGADADTTYNVSQYDLVRVASGALSANRTYTLGSTGAATGSMMRIYTDDATYQLDVRRADASLIASMQRAVTGKYQWIDVLWIGGRWELSGFYNKVA